MNTNGSLRSPLVVFTPPFPFNNKRNVNPPTPHPRTVSVRSNMPGSDAKLTCLVSPYTIYS